MTKERQTRQDIKLPDDTEEDQKFAERIKELLLKEEKLFLLFLNQ